MSVTPESTLRAVIPVKRFDTAKSRLAGLLRPDQRAALAEAMFRDVLDTAQAAGLFSGISVVTECPRAAAIAREAGAEVIADAHPAAGTNAAVETALATVPPDSGAMIIQADLPLLEPEDLRRIAETHRAGSGVTIVPALDGGTTILVLAKPDLIRPAFGPHSFARHITAARASGIEPQLLAPRNALCDLDRPADLALLGACRRHSHTARIARLARLPDLAQTSDGEGHDDFRTYPRLVSFP